VKLVMRKQTGKQLIEVHSLRKEANPNVSHSPLNCERGKRVRMRLGDRDRWNQFQIMRGLYRQRCVHTKASIVGSGGHLPVVRNLVTHAAHRQMQRKDFKLVGIEVSFFVEPQR